jgi:hypothetical protein
MWLQRTGQQWPPSPPERLVQAAGTADGGGLHGGTEVGTANQLH